ncbi:MAG: hypothetical protein LBC17_00325 [Lactobacillaceae bacterium]|jgi:biotin-(acetyl-CoA carboxylase) ligase|nr:hypothetical protein [Lactobacillaceae bacterium]
MYRLIKLKTIDSTQDYAKKLQLDPPFVVQAKQQTNGHGKVNRKFISKDGLFFTLVVGDLRQRPGLIVGAVAVSIIDEINEVLKKKFGNEHKSQFGIKWVNDIVDENFNKAGGILVDKRNDQYYIGVGLNFNTSAVNLPNITFIPEIKIDNLIKKILNQLISSDTVSKYKKYSFIIGRKVILKINDLQISGIVNDISDDLSIIINNKKYQIGEIEKIILKDYDF